MEDFNEILRDSAHRNKEQQDVRLQVPKNPMQTNHTYWGWIATPAAAVVGIFLGVSFPQFSQHTDVIAHVTDTVFVPQTFNDTVYLTKVEKVYVVKHDIVYLQKQAPVEADLIAQKNDQSLDDITLCTSIQCDGINYALLASN